jgi:hypothetical protein
MGHIKGLSGPMARTNKAQLVVSIDGEAGDASSLLTQHDILCAMDHSKSR